MATKSFLKNINVTGRNNARKLVNALENAERYKGEKVYLEHPVEFVHLDNVSKVLSSYRFD